MPRDYHSRPTTPAFAEAWDRMHDGSQELDMSMDRFLTDGREGETLAEWRERVLKEPHG